MSVVTVVAAAEVVNPEEAAARNLETAAFNMADRFYEGLWDYAQVLHSFKSMRAFALLDAPDGSKFKSFKAWCIANKERLRHGYSWASTLVQAQDQRLELNLPLEQLPIDALQDTIPAIESLRQRTHDKPRRSDADKPRLTPDEARSEALRLIDQAIVLQPRQNKQAIKAEFSDIETLVDCPMPISDLTDEQVSQWGLSDRDPDAVVYIVVRSDPKITLPEELMRMQNDAKVDEIRVHGRKIAVQQSSEDRRCTKCGQTIRKGARYTRRARYNERAGVYPFCERCRPFVSED